MKSMLSSVERIYRNITRLDPKRYESILWSLKNKGYNFILPRDLPETLDDTEKVCVVVHDVDVRTSGCRVFVEIEEKLGVRSAFFLRPDAEYFSDSIDYFQRLEWKGWEIGFHYDCLGRREGNMKMATELFHAQLEHMRAFFKVTSTRSHGDPLHPKVYNEYLYISHQEGWRILGLKDFTILPVQYSYIRDTHGKLVIPKPILNVILVNCHSDWF